MKPVAPTPAGYAIEAPHAHELEALPAIELKAAELLPLEDLGLELRATGLPLEFFETAAAAGRLWVARHVELSLPVGFAALTLVDAAPHLYELDVLPEHGRRGLGRALVLHAAQWSRTHGFDTLSLTTFRDIPWNAPFYASVGFREVPGTEQGEELSQMLAREARRGLDPDKRVAMRLRLTRR